ncbi:uncharacterized protein B0H64DRAFT_240758 [Chaetomium fimeti]|uniref:Uncharacterized protein n=1 Tax=Chaetomium fimeti TaxID=1854472 RepID=A0AAE0H8H3_9PEZI|nr:hypothetical protein B0H64DRAFT_240758 [Chaetomium fimeti]
MIDAAELRRRWSDKTNAVFSAGDRQDSHTFAAESFEREFDFKGCQSIVFLNGVRTGREEDVILLTQGTGHMALPAGVQVLVQSGFVKCNSPSRDGASIVGPGARAPPPTLAAGYAPSSADSGYSGSVRGNTVDSYRMSPPRDAAAFMRGPPAASSYMSAADIPLPRSTAGRSNAGASSSEWEVVGELDGFQDRARDDCSIAPSESISSVGSRGQQFSRRATHNF